MVDVVEGVGVLGSCAISGMSALRRAATVFMLAFVALGIVGSAHRPESQGGGRRLGGSGRGGAP